MQICTSILNNHVASIHVTFNHMAFNRMTVQTLTSEAVKEQFKRAAAQRQMEMEPDALLCALQSAILPVRMHQFLFEVSCQFWRRAQQQTGLLTVRGRNKGSSAIIL